MKAHLTSFSYKIGYGYPSFSDRAIDVTFVTQTPSKFHNSQVEIRFTDLDLGAFGDLQSSSYEDEWDIEIKLTRKPKPQTQTFHFK